MLTMMPTSFAAMYTSALLLISCSLGLGFAPSPLISAPTNMNRCITSNSIHNIHTQLYMSNDEIDISKGASSSSSSSSSSTLFPVISKIAGKEWTGSCRFINASLQHATNLKLYGGVKYDIANDNTLTLSSFLSFPNGKTRQVVMQGSRDKRDGTAMMLTPVEDGPIVMQLSEIVPDTILINEVEKESGRIIMTSSISIVQTNRGTELVGVSHEVGESGKDAIEGHQLWRMMDRSSQKEISLSREFE